MSCANSDIFSENIEPPHVILLPLTLYDEDGWHVAVPRPWGVMVSKTYPRTAIPSVSQVRLLALLAVYEALKER
jgi:hypothetical protein